jgi:hypothetical protein
VRTLASFDYDRLPAIGVWPVNEVLLAFQEHVKRRAHADYQHKVAIWAMTLQFRKQKNRPPMRPSILDD